MARFSSALVLLSGLFLPTARGEEPAVIWQKIAPHFKPPEQYAKPSDKLRSPLLFEDGTPVKTAADWQKRRQEILKRWHGLLGPWPELIEKPKVEILETTKRDNFVQHKVRFDLAPKHPTTGYLLIPEGEGKRPAVVVVYYEPETGIGLKGENRDFALQLAKRGFVTLSIGIGASLYYPDREKAQLQPLSALAYGAANAYFVLANRPEVDPERIGVVGHSYGGKWAMFASCLFDRFACGAWSDGGIVFDEKRSNVNYWEPWYLGYDGPKFRKAGIPSDANPRTGAYKKLIAEELDLHELHALMAPRPFLVSGGSEDPPARWEALNHAVAVNKLLGHDNRVAMTNRPKHGPTPESNEQMYLFFEYFLKHGKVK
ncbi:MAG: dienelactone hydrolase family protein [Gemmataceae bacterium]